MWRFHQCGWPCLEVCPPRYPSSRACSAQTACSAAGCTCARGTAASASLCWCRRRCEWSGTVNRAPDGKAGRSCRWSPGNDMGGGGGILTSCQPLGNLTIWYDCFFYVTCESMFLWALLCVVCRESIPSTMSSRNLKSRQHTAHYVPIRIKE